MKSFGFVFVIFILTPFSFIYGDSITSLCSKSGYTVLTINGIFTNEQGAQDNKEAIRQVVGNDYKGEKINVQYLLNPSHIGGVGDLVKAAYQKYFDRETVQDYDLVQMISSASEKVKTQKLLVVAHSQGNFYANSFYDSVADKPGNVPSQSLAVYAVATPSGRVAGGGKWLTSDTDKVIAGLVASLPGRGIRKPNTHVELAQGDDKLGHDFTGVYLKYNGERIVNDVAESLSQLETNHSQGEQKPCIAPPKITKAHKIEGVAFAVIDPIARTAGSAAGIAMNGMYKVTLALGSAAKQAASAVLSTSVGNSGETAETPEKSSALPSADAVQNEAPNIGVIAGSANTESAGETAGPGAVSPATESAAQPPAVAPAYAPPISAKDNVPMPKFNFGHGGISPGFGGGGAPTNNLRPSAINQQEAGQSENLNAETNSTNSSGSTETSTSTSGIATSSSPTPATCEDATATNFGSPLPCTYPPPAPTTCEDISAANFGGELHCLYRPTAPAVISPSDFSTAFATTTMTFVGTTSPNFVISNDFNSDTAVANSDGSWSLAFIGLAEGAGTINFTATDLNTTLVSNPLEINFIISIPRPAAPTITSPAPPFPLRAKSITFSGTATPGLSISNDFSSTTSLTASSTGAWSIAFSNLPEGTTTINFFATDGFGLQSSPSAVTFDVYTFIPKVTGISVIECANSFTISGCGIPDGTATLSWSVTSPNWTAFEVRSGTSATGYSLVALATTTSIVVPVSEGGNTFTVTIVNIFGQADSYYSSYTVSSGNVASFSAYHMPVVINEIAWGGTKASSAGEWIELLNRTNRSINLSSFSISAEDGTPTIPLSGSIPVGGYFLIERGNAGDVFNDTTADLAVPFSGTTAGSGLNNEGEVLSLIFSATGTAPKIIDTTPALSACGGWCAGSASPEYKTMERRQADTIGSDKTNWQTNDGARVSGTDKDGNAVNGTPKTWNSASMGKVGFYCLPYTASFVEGGWYQPAIRSGAYLDCHFYSYGLSGYHYDDIYRGTVGNAVRIGRSSSGASSYDKTLNIPSDRFVQGENYFAGMYEESSTADIAAFENYFTGASTSSPPENRKYGVINWRYGSAP